MLSISLPKQLWLTEEKIAARALVSLYRENQLGSQIAIYFDPEYTAIYSLGTVGEWLFVSVIDREWIKALVERNVIDFRRDSGLGLDVLTFRDEIFAAVDCDFGEGKL